MKKKCLWIIAVVVVLATIGIVVVVSQNNSEKKAAEELFPKIQEIVSAPEIKTIGVDGLQISADLNKEHFERLGALSLVVKVKNTSDKVLQKAVMAKTLFDKSGAAIGLKNTQAADVPQLKPGEIHTANLDMISANAQSIGRIEIFFREVVWAGAPVSVASTTTPNQVAPSILVGGNYNTLNYPQNPQNPEEVVAAFYFLLNEKRYLAAARLIEKAEPLIESGKITEKQIAADLGKFFQPGDLVSIKTELASIYKTAEGVDKAQVGITLYFKDGKNMHTTPSLVQENGKWKIGSSNF